MRVPSILHRSPRELAKLGEEGSERYEEIRKDVDRAIGDLKKGIDEIVERIRKAA